MLLPSAKRKGKEFKPGILATLHKSGNGFNYNPVLMLKDTVYSFLADSEMKKLVKTHGIRNGVEAFFAHPAQLRH